MKALYEYQFENDVKASDRILVYGLFAAGIAIFASKSTDIHGAFILGSAGLIILAGHFLLSSLIWKQTIRVFSTHIELERKNRFRTKRQSYPFKHIENVRVDLNVKSDQYTSVGRVRVLGMDRTPESWKTYYYYPEVLSFDYKGELIEIGKNKKAFNAEMIKTMIVELKQHHER